MERLCRTPRGLCATLAAGLLLSPALAQAVPSFARQTGLECGNCHLSWLELSSVGREFKLGGDTLMKEGKKEGPWLPLPMQSNGPPTKLALREMRPVSAPQTNDPAGSETR